MGRTERRKYSQGVTSWLVRALSLERRDTAAQRPRPQGPRPQCPRPQGPRPQGPRPQGWGEGCFFGGVVFLLLHKGQNYSTTDRINKLTVYFILWLRVKEARVVRHDCTHHHHHHDHRTVTTSRFLKTIGHQDNQRPPQCTCPGRPRRGRPVERLKRSRFHGSSVRVLVHVLRGERKGIP